jgi:maltose O-acetyltransferase
MQTEKRQLVPTHRDARDPRPASEPRPAPGIVRLVRTFVSSFSLRQSVVIWLEEWIGGLVRPIPSLLGFGLRYLFYRAVCERLAGFCFIYCGARIAHSYGMRIGRNLHVNSGAYLYGRGGLTIGDNVLVGQNALILSSQHQWTDPNVPIVFQGHQLGPVAIGDDVWIGANAVILPGLTIATGTVVGAGAVVTRDTQPYSIMGGVPARKIGERPRPAAGSLR